MTDTELKELIEDCCNDIFDRLEPLANVKSRLYTSLKEAINYTRCCTELKDKETITFEEWKKENVVETNVCNEYLYKYGGWFDENDLLSMYKKDISI